MSELIDRYVHQVGRYLPPRERAEIEAELRSQIQDQLDDRFAETPTPENVASLLAEIGHPYMVAASYSSDQYLVGPLFYPYMMMVLRHGWLLLPAIVIFVNVFGELVAAQKSNVPTLLVETIIAVLQTIFIFSGVVILFFALMQRAYIKIDAKSEDFNPLDLPKVDDPHTVDRFESGFGIAFGIIVELVLLYFLSVGGLTLRFNLSNPGEVIPVPTLWLLLLIITAFALLVLIGVVLRRNRWNTGLWLTDTLLEVFGVVCLYFVLYEPVYAHLVKTVEALANVSPDVPEAIAVLTAISTLVTRSGKLVSLWNYGSTPPFSAKPNE
jgi:hypothetical protein